MIAILLHLIYSVRCGRDAGRFTACAPHPTWKSFRRAMSSRAHQDTQPGLPRPISEGLDALDESGGGEAPR